MKRRGGPSTRSTRLLAQQSSTDPSVTLFKLEPDGHDRLSKRVKVEADAATEVSTSPQKAKAKGKGKAKEIKQALDTPHPAPPHWRETYDAIREMRARMPAPVDTMGCDTAKWKETDPRVRLSIFFFYCFLTLTDDDMTSTQNKRFATLISLMLSSQTKDEVTDAAVDKLRAALGGTLSLEGLLAAEEQVVAECISKVGFWRRKTQSVGSLFFPFLAGGC